MLRIVFMGTPQFATASLEALVNSAHKVVAVVTAPDKPAGRGKKMRRSEVKKYAVEKNLPVLQPQKLKDETFLNQLQSYNADLFIVVAFRMLPKVVWAMPRLGTFNLHASLLPRYRGAAPINHVLINGEKETGVTTFLLDEKIDTGKILMQKKIAIEDDDDAGTLHDKLMQMGSRLTVETADALEHNNVKPVAQPAGDENLPTAPKIFKDDCLIHWNNPAVKIKNLIRGLSPYPAAFTKIVSPHDNKVRMLKIYKVQLHQDGSMQPGEIKTDGKSRLFIGAGDGFLEIKDLQMEGKKRMDIKSFLNGFKQISEYRIDNTL